VPAYPFSQRPLFVDFKTILCEEFGCVFNVLEFQLNSTDFYSVPHFERNMAGRQLRASAIFEDYDRLEFSDVRRICRTLEIPAARFGLTLTELWTLDPDD
jgi:hypothetical protein